MNSQIELNSFSQEKDKPTFPNKDKIEESDEKEDSKTLRTESSALFVSNNKTIDNSWRSFGRVRPYFLRNKEEPDITIGPHYWLSIVFMLFFSIFLTIFYIYFNEKVKIYEKIIGIGLGILLFTSYLYTCLVNPGIPNLDNYYLIENSTVHIKKCRECRNYIRMDMLTKHCYDCGVCVEGYDHHCPWIGKCVGRKNLFAFYVFVSSMMSLFMYMIFIAAYYGSNV